MNEKRIALNKYTLTDFDRYKALVHDDEVMKYISKKGLTENEARTKFNAIMEVNHRENELGYFKVLNRENEYIGDCKLEHYRCDNSVLEIGYILKKEFWGKGFGTEICKEVLALANNFNPALDIIGIIDPDNHASKKLLEKFGFERYFIGVENEVPTEKLILKRSREG